MERAGIEPATSALQSLLDPWSVGISGVQSGLSERTRASRLELGRAGGSKESDHNPDQLSESSEPLDKRTTILWADGTLAYPNPEVPNRTLQTV